MDDPHKNLRIAAAKAFMESLEELENILAEDRPGSESPSSELIHDPSEPSIDLSLLEEVAADLAKFFGEEELWEEEE
ncbi:MAG TPA: hypothetical protein DEG17_05535 [Cyanobacteria bacterium UBA11149]|nr:hypothetical protein [Cyanobacteria bacterium UBA11367]HBE57789.1 hypothetical protein [Cyanobacteria bacterium UBA11366]HBK61981.1 hypothetical protein [Cyanobacteria bacterium UBA11166]HBR74450.1 hypothetical protein [Cyanobacteria bacterium UBA11159]HBS70544.1 hypothetical protein [Cyanobacteria bacterium UBA11153]HBW88340.1 hypothetical protein [Cyanobacteria bacterium UBA11149]HCA97266.1 hypothetical protein [Cyanobacteria bacterium UBA9226]